MRQPEITTETTLNAPGTPRNLYTASLGFALLCILPLLLAWDSTRALISLTLNDDTYSHIPLIPVVTVFLIYMERRAIFSRVSYGWRIGSLLILPGAVGVLLARTNVVHLSSADRLSVLMFAVILIWMGGFALFFGTRAFRAALFPLVFLLFAVPIPEILLVRLIGFLQRRSADAAGAMFNMVGVPVLRQDLIFMLPGVSIRVAEECSGIRSTLALFITTVLAAHFFLRSKWSMLLLCLLVFPISIIKNGMRIATLTCLAVYVDPGFLHGNLHRYGGIPFFFLDLLVLGLFLALLRRVERGGTPGASNTAPQVAR